MRIKFLLAAVSLFFTCLAPAQRTWAGNAPDLQQRVHHPVSSSNPEAVNFFEQGLFFIYAFNHDQAIRCFQEAARLDPNFALAHWGIALALGPDINLDSDPPRQRGAFFREELARNPRSGRHCTAFGRA